MCEVPVRCAKFIVRKQWIVAGTDDMHLRVYNYNTMEKVKAWEAHTDYIRYVEIHPNRPFIIRYVRKKNAGRLHHLFTYSCLLKT